MRRRMARVLRSAAIRLENPGLVKSRRKAWTPAPDGKPVQVIVGSGGGGHGGGSGGYSVVSLQHHTPTT